MHRSSLPPGSPALTLSSCAEPIPATFPLDEVSVSPWPWAPDRVMLSIFDGEAIVPYLFVLPKNVVTPELCARYRAFVRGEALPALEPGTHVPRLEP